MSQNHTWVDALHRGDWALPSGLCSANSSDVAQRFGIYRNNVLSACTHALADTFPVCQALVGEAFFSALTLAFAQQHLPRSRRLAFYGQGFAEFVRQFPPAQSLPYLADVAMLEMARVEAYHAADADGVSPAYLQAALQSGSDMRTWRFALHPSLHLMDSPMAALSLWQAHQHDAKKRDALLADIDLHSPECTAVFRNDDAVLCISLTVDEVALLRGLQDGLALGVAIAHAPEDTDISHTLALLIQHQLITDLIEPQTQGDRP